MRLAPLLASAVVCSSLSLASAPALAGALDARGVVILCYETADGADTRRCSLEPELRRLLRAEGAVLVDQAQAERLKAQYTPERFAAGKDLKGIDLLDADLGVIAKIDVVKDAAAGKVGRYRQNVTIDVLDTSRATVIATTSFEAQVNGTSASDALAYLARAFAKDKSAAFTSELVAAVNAPQGVELWVYGLPDGVGTVQQVEDAVTKGAQTTALRKVGFDAKVAKWRLTLKPGVSADALAARLEKDGPMLAVQGVAGGLVQLAYRPDRHVKLSCGVDVKPHKGAPAWLGQSLDGLVKHALLGAGWITPVETGATTKLAVTSQSAGKGRVAFTLELVRSDGARIASTRETGALDDAPAIVSRGVDKLLGGLKRWLSANPSQLVDFRRALEAPRALEVHVKAGDDGVIDGAALAAGKGLGAVTFAPRLDDARVRVVVVGVTGQGAWRPAKGEEGELVVEDSEKLLALAAMTPVRLEVEIEGRIGDRLYRERAGAAVLYRPLNSVDREQLDTFARVVSSSPAWAAQLVTPALADAVAVPSASLGRAARAWDRIVAQGVVLEPATDDGERFMLVQTPHATLSSGKGDARALLALMATAFEAAGVETRLVRTPSSWLVAIDTELPAGAWPLVARSPKGVLVDGGRMFAPVDPSAVGVDLWSAIARGADDLERHAGRLQVSSPRQAWATHKSARDAGTVAVRANKREPVKLLVLDVKGDKLAADARAVLGQRLTKAMAAVPELKVLSSADLRGMLDVEAQRQAAGCDEASCLAEIAGAVGARFFASAQVATLGGALIFAATLTDTKTVEVLARTEVQAADAALLAGRIDGAAARLAGAALEREGVVASGPWSYEAHVARLREKLAADPYARARFFAMAGDLAAAAAEAAKVKAADKRKVVDAHLVTLKKDPAARAALLAW